MTSGARNEQGTRGWANIKSPVGHVVRTAAVRGGVNGRDREASVSSRSVGKNWQGRGLKTLGVNHRPITGRR